MNDDSPSSMTEPLASASRVRRAAQVIQDAVTRLEQAVDLREQRNTERANSGRLDNEEVARQLEQIADGLEQVATQMDRPNA